MMNRVLAAWALAFASLSGEAGEIVDLEELYGPGDLRAVTGNGGLTVGINDAGTISLCRWPSPSYSDHLNYRSRVDAEGKQRAGEGEGLRWGLQIGGQTIRMNDPRWSTRHEYTGAWPPVIRSTSTLRDSTIRVVRTLAVHPERDVFASRISVSGYQDPPALRWAASFAPCTVKYPEVPLADWYDDTRNGFAAFARGNGEEVYHFRPVAPGIDEWSRAEALTSGQEPFEGWQDFGPGIWIAQGASAEVTHLQLGPGFVASLEDPPVRQADQQSAIGTPFSTQSILAEEWDDGHVGASVFVAIGESFSDARDSLRWAKARGYAAFMDDVRQGKSEPAAAPTNSRSDEENVAQLMDRLRSLLLVMQDRRSGAVVRSPAAQPPLARDWPRHAHWMTYALDLAGFQERAEEHCLFLANAVRRVHRRGMPVGSLPATLYADGVPASPHVVLDLEAPSGMIRAMRLHGTLLPAKEREEFFGKVWPAVELSGDFLASWMDARDGSPLHSFDLGRLGDAQSFDLLVATRTGILQAIEIATLAGKDAPESWTRRESQLGVRLLNHLANLEEPWPVGARLPFSITDLISATDSLFEEAAAPRLEALPRLEGHRAARVLVELAMLYRGNASKLAQLEPYVLGALNSVLTGESEALGNSTGTAFPDGLSIAMAYIAATLIGDAAGS